MATLTTNISSVSLTVSGTTQQSTTISWTLPSVPSDVTINSCKLTGTATASMSKGSATITVNGTTVSSGSSFTVNLGTSNTTSSVTATAKGGNKNAAGTVTFSNLVYTVTYTEPVQNYIVTFIDWDGTVLKTQSVESGGSAIAPTVPSRFGYTFTGWDKSFTNITSDLTVTAQYESVPVLMTKENGIWVNIPKIYKRISGVWIEQANNNWSDLFESNTSYIKKVLPNFISTAILYEDGTLIFSNNDLVSNSHGAVVETYTGWDKDTYSTHSSVPWYNNHNKVLNIVINNAKPISIKWWFYQCSKLTDVDFAGLDTRNITNMNNMFSGCSSLTSLDLSNFDTSNVTDMGAMFDECSSLTSLNLSNFDTSNVTGMYTMFDGCSSLISLDLSNFDTSHVIDMSSMFESCSSLTNLNLSNFNTSHVTDMKQMFDNCSSLTSLDLSNFDTSNVSSMYRMFKSCSSLTNLNLSNFDTSHVRSMYHMFRLCSSLTSLDLSNFDTSNVIDMSLMFSGCSSLTSLNLNNFNVNNVTNNSDMFQYCSNANLKIYVSTEEMANWVKATSNFPSTATVVIGKPT